MTNWQFGSQFAVEFEEQMEKGILENVVFCEKTGDTIGLAVVAMKKSARCRHLADYFYEFRLQAQLMKCLSMISCA